MYFPAKCDFARTWFITYLAPLVTHTQISINLMFIKQNLKEEYPTMK